MLFLKLLIGVLICIILSWLFSWLFFWRKEIKTLQNIVIRLILGSVIAVSLFATIATKFQTIFLLSFPILFSIGYFLNIYKLETITIKKSQIIAFFFMLFIALSLGFLNIYGIDFNGFKVPINDQSFYTNVAYNTTYFNSESFISYLNKFYGLEKTTMLYHYYEHWFTAFIYQFTKFNIHLILNGIITSFSFFCTFLAFYLFLNNTSKKYNWLIVITAILFLFLRGFNHYFPSSELSFINATDSILFDGNQKLIYPLPLFILSIYFLLNFLDKQVGLLVLLLLPILNIVFSPSIIGALILYFCFVFCLNIKSISVQFKQHVLFILNVILFIVLLFIFIKYFSINFGTDSLVTSIGGVLSNVYRNLKSWILIQLPLLCVIFYFLYYVKKKESIFILVLLLGIAFSGAFGYAILDNNQNAWQMFACASRLSVIGLFLFLVQLAKGNFKYYYVTTSLVSLLSLIMFVENYSTISHLPLKKISSYSPSYINEISKINFKNKIGVKFVNASTRPELQRNPVYAGIVNYFCLTENAYTTVVLNIQDLMPIPKDTIYNFETLKVNSIVKEIIVFSPFLSANNMSNKTYNLNDLKFEQEKFIINNKPEFCILESGVQFPDNIKKYIKKSFYDDGTKEEFLLLKY